MSSLTELHVCNLKTCSLVWDYPTFLELNFLFLHKMIGDGRYFLVAVHVLFLKLKLNFPSQIKIWKPYVLPKSCEIVLDHKIPKFGNWKTLALRLQHLSPLTSQSTTKKKLTTSSLSLLLASFLEFSNIRKKL